MQFKTWTYNCKKVFN